MNLPQKKTSKTPVLIILHGYGSNENDLFDIAKSFDERLMTFAIRAPYSAGMADGYSWFGLKKDEKGQRLIDYPEMELSRKKIISFISHACKEYKLDSSQVFIMGFSQGSMMCYELAFSSPLKIKGIMALSGLLVDQTKEINPKTEQLSKVNFFIAHGNQDNIIDLSYAKSITQYLSEKKILFTYKEYQIPHSICGDELNDMKDFLRKNLKKEKAKEAKH